MVQLKQDNLGGVQKKFKEETFEPKLQTAQWKGERDWREEGEGQVLELQNLQCWYDFKCVPRDV